MHAHLQFLCLNNFYFEIAYMCNDKCVSTQLPCNGKCFDSFWKCPNEELCIPLDNVCNRIDIINIRGMKRCKDNSQFTKEVCEDPSLFKKTICTLGNTKCLGNF